MKKIQGVIKDYAWGGHDFISRLLHRPNPENAPFAEYWLGTHPLAISELADSSTTLVDYLKGFGQSDLPFLFKVLDVKDMLSIQAHPSKQLAERGFERENKKGIPLDSPQRTFKDANHKPEIMVALSDFWLLQGFRQPHMIRETLRDQPEFTSLAPIYENEGLQGFCQYILSADQEEINSVLRPLGKRLIPLYESGRLDRSEIEFWSARAFITYNRKGFCDRGIIFLHLMNLVHLKKGEAAYQYPGLLHAYLEGQNVECMATSDNVVRAGLTQKYCNIQAFIECVDFTHLTPHIITPVLADANEWLYDCPSDAFALSHIKVSNDKAILKPRSYSILMTLDGSGKIDDLDFKTGDAFLISPGEECQISSNKEASLFKASSP